MNAILGMARRRNHPENLEEFKRLQALCSDIAECVVVEQYRDSEALLERFANLGERGAALFETCSAAGELCGSPHRELMKALEGSPVRMFSPYLSL